MRQRRFVVLAKLGDPAQTLPRRTVLRRPLQSTLVVPFGAWSLSVSRVQEKVPQIRQHGLVRHRGFAHRTGPRFHRTLEMRESPAFEVPEHLRIEKLQLDAIHTAEGLLRIGSVEQGSDELGKLRAAVFRLAHHQVVQEDETLRDEMIPVLGKLGPSRDSLQREPVSLQAESFHSKGVAEPP